MDVYSYKYGNNRLRHFPFDDDDDDDDHGDGDGDGDGDDGHQGNACDVKSGFVCNSSNGDNWHAEDGMDGYIFKIDQNRSV